MIRQALPIAGGRRNGKWYLMTCGQGRGMMAAVVPLMYRRRPIFGIGQPGNDHAAGFGFVAQSKGRTHVGRQEPCVQLWGSAFGEA